MNVFRVLNLLATVVAVNCVSNADPLLTSHVAPLVHSNPLGTPFLSSTVSPLHHSTPFSHTTHAPFAFSHQPSLAPVSIKHHGTTSLVGPHHLGAPVTHGHHIAAPVAHAHPVAAHGVNTHHVAPAVAVSHHGQVVGLPQYHTPGYSVATPHNVHVKSGSYLGHSVPATTHYHGLNNLGQYSNGYRDAYGNLHGSYSHADPYNRLQTQRYVPNDYSYRVSRRHKRSYAKFPASTSPLTTYDYASPVVHRVSSPVYKTSHAIHKPVHHVVHKPVPAVHKVSHVVHKAVPAVHKVSHVVHKPVPIVHNVAPVVHDVGPVIHGDHYNAPSYGYGDQYNAPSYGYGDHYNAPSYGYGNHYSAPSYGYPYTTGPYYNDYKSYNRPYNGYY